MASTFDVSTNAGSFAEVYADAGRYFRGRGFLNYALEQLAADLRRHDIDYVVIGGVALFAHGYRRFTNNIDIVLTAEGLERFVTSVNGRALQTLGKYDPDVTSYKRVHSVPHGISIRVMTTGEYPGDGKPKPVSIPEPSAASTEIDGVRFVTFEKLIELKLASGITAPHRLKDLANVQELIKIRGLQPEFAERLDPYVREKFVELAEAVKQSPKD
ncbi:MAG TPA: hypothetical protein VGN90_11390 [Pyrinomonadaceae bacterium]|jgi:hypothetical protein|nr:hypothetical protein [Pyrinomonadaceae bacterium]